MKIVRSKYFPLGNFAAMNVLGIWLFVKPKVRINDRMMNHELIHSAQYKELWYIGFLILYGLEYLIKLLIYFNFHKSYRNISFEREAYTNQDNMHYLKDRKSHSWINYVIKK